MADSDESPKRGPLDDLVPGLCTADTKLPLQAVHPRALELPLSAGGRALVLCTWQAPSSAAELHQALRPLVEAALLAELSQPVEELRDSDQALHGLQLFSFAPYPYDVTEALAPFGLQLTQERDGDYRSAAALLRREAQRVEGDTPEDPVARYTATWSRPPDLRVIQAEAQALQQAPEGPWGSEPGRLARVFADALAAEGLHGIEPTHAGISAFEKLLVPDQTDAVRWMAPIAFQALCDLLAVAAHSWGMEVQWGVCEPDEDTHLAPPPLIRASRGSTSGHVPLGEHVLRWCIMPRRTGETIPPLADWARHEFAP